MTFLAPIYLLLLVPWAGVVAWVLFGRAEFARVSTTQFWEKTDTSTAPRRGLRKPPLWAVLMLLAMLAAILAASGLGYYGSGSRVRWVVDRGLLTITALERDQSLRARIDTTRVTAVPDSSDPFRPTTHDTAGALEQAVKRVLSETNEPVVVVTAQAIAIDDPRVTILQPAYAVRNMGIDHFAVVTDPRPQAMVRVWNGTTASQATLRVDRATRTIDLPPAGETRDYFVDLETPGDVVTATLDADDDIDADDHAWAARQAATPRLALSPGLSESVRRFAAVYDQTRRPAADAAVVSVSNDPDATAPAVVVRAGTTAPPGDVRVVEHPVNRWIDWPAIAPLIREVVADSPPRGTPIVWIGDRPVVAADAGRVEIGFDVSKLASRAELVLLLQNAIEFAASGRGEYSAVDTGAIGRGWTLSESAASGVDHPPGVYQEMSERRAANMRAVRAPTTPPSANPPIPAAGRQVVSLDRVLLTLSVAGVLAGVFCLTPIGRRVR